MALGYRHPDLLLEQLTAEQFEEWKIYYSLEPWGQTGEDLQHAYTRKTFADVMGSKNRQNKSPTIQDMTMVRLIKDSRKQWRRDMKIKTKPQKQQSVEDMKSVLMGIASHHSKGLKPKKKPGRGR